MFRRNGIQGTVQPQPGRQGLSLPDKLVLFSTDAVALFFKRGNAFDRFTLGYVVDFIEPVFIDFPVFNVADIGVTCGFVLFVAGMILAYRRADREAAALAEGSGEPQAPGDGGGEGPGER